jgi:hypothetical protein
VPRRGDRNEDVGAQNRNQRRGGGQRLVQPHDGKVHLPLVQQPIVVLNAGRGHQIEAHAGAVDLEQAIEGSQYRGVDAILRPGRDTQVNRLGP